MSAVKFDLLARRRFGPLFATQFAGAFNDNLFRSAMLFSLSFGIGRSTGAHQAALLAALAGATFIAPYFLFSGLAGQVADRTDKATVARLVKVAEFAIMVVGGAGLVLQSIPLLFAALFAMGVHSTFFGPVKYAILPQHLSEAELLAGTGMVEAGTFLSILLGQIAGGIMHHEAAAMAVLLVAAAGTAASLLIPTAPATEAPTTKLDLNPLTSTRSIIAHARSNPGVFRSALGITWFFALGGVLTQEMPPLAVQIGASQSVAVLLLAIFSIGVACGSILVGRLQNGVVSARFVPVSALVVALATLDLGLSTGTHAVTGPGIDGFLRNPGSWRILADVMTIAIAGGVYVVPLYALLQTLGDPARRSREIAANNIVNAIGMVAVAGIAAALAGAGASISKTFLTLGTLGVGVAGYSCVLLPEASIKHLLKAILRIAYRVEVHGSDNMPLPGERAVVVVNHTSFLDAAVLAAFLPGRPTFAVATKIAEAWWMRPLLRLFDAFPVDPTNPMSAKAMVKAVREGRTLVIFPEGRITVTGSLMKIFDGPAMVADKAEAPIVPVRIDGAQYTPFSRLKGKVRRRLFPRIRLTVLEPSRIELPEGGSARERRQAAGRALYDRMSDMVFQTSGPDLTLFEALIHAARIHGGRAKILEDVKRRPISYLRLLTGAFVLGRKIDAVAAAEEARLPSDDAIRTRTVGLLLPNINEAVVAFFGLHACERVPTMLNFTAGPRANVSACRTARVQVVVTSRAFVSQAKLDAVVSGLEAAGVRILHLEDVPASVSVIDKLRGLLAAKIAMLRGHPGAPSKPAVVLLTSGTEGEPKGVVLSHLNLISNARQLASRIDFNPTDVVLNALPIFHSFGLGGGTLLPLLNGVKVFLYPSPLHYRIVPAVAYDSNATILFGTSTFLAGYARMANPYDFYSIRYIFAGAEKVNPEVRQTYADKFGLRIMEGYGTTETSPVIAVNTPMHFKAGSVGRLLPGMKVRYESIPGIDKGARMFVQGPNVMLGYYMSDAPGILVPPPEGWHDTGDVTTTDGDGFIWIEARAKRFCKIGAEMVSMPAVELDAGKVWPGAAHAVSKKPDPKKGEALVLYTTAPHATAAEFSAWAKANGLSELSVPKDVRVIPSLPVLGTGKTDYVTLDAMALVGSARTEPDEESEEMTDA